MTKEYLENALNQLFEKFIAQNNASVAMDKKKDATKDAEDNNKKADEPDNKAEESKEKTKSDDNNLEKKIKDGIEVSKSLAKDGDDEEELGKNSSLMSKCDNAYRYMGKDTPPPYQNETSEAYAKRILRPMISYSKDWEEIGLDDIVKNKKLLDKAFPDITKAVIDKNSTQIEDANELRVIRENRDGKIIDRTVGSPKAYINSYGGYEDRIAHFK